MIRTARWIAIVFFVVTGALPTFAKSLKLTDETIDKLASQPLVVGDANLTFTVGQIYRQISRSRMLLEGGILNADGAKQVIDSIVVDSLVALEAPKVNIRQYRLDYRDYRHQLFDSVIQALVLQEVMGKTQADSMEVLKFFHDNTELFTAEEQVKLWHILISPKGLIAKSDSIYNRTHNKDQIANDARELVWNLYRALQYGESFKNLAFLYSHDILSAKKSGFVGWTPRGKYLDPFDSVAFSLKSGEFSQPYHDQDGWHMVLVEGRIQGGILPIDSPFVYDMARSSLLTLRSNQRGDHFVDSLYQVATISENPAIMESDINTVDDTVWVGIVNQRDTMYAWEMKQFEQGMRLQNDIPSFTAEMKKDALRLMAQRYLLAQAAEDMGVTAIPQVAAYERQLHQNTSREIINRRGQDFNWTPDDSTIERIYKQESSSIDVNKPITVQQVVVKDSMFAIFLKDQANSGVPFEDFTKKEFLDAVNPGAKVKLSGLRRIGEKDVPRAYWLAVLGIEPGKVSSVFRIKNEFYVAKVHDRIATRNVLGSKGDIRVRLEQQHRRQVWQKFRDDLYRTYGVRFVNTVELLTLKPYRIRNADHLGGK